MDYLTDSANTARPDREELQNRRANFRKTQTKYKASRFLLPECHPSLRPGPTLVYYGVGILQEELEAYAEKNGFFPNEHGFDEVSQWLHAWHCSLALFSKKANFELDLAITVSPDYDLVIAVYSNIEYMRNPLSLKDEKEVVSIIAQELGVRRKARWHYDFDALQGAYQWDWTPPTKEQVEKIRAEYRKCRMILEYDPERNICRGVKCTDDGIPLTGDVVHTTAE
ncbi:hypothetical protein BDW22DRAFT_1360232 [Trametopsis cervina]|nr:hypothetical protein BDW22DRAFT_1360232 [Trametopsis cervina]